MCLNPDRHRCSVDNSREWSELPIQTTRERSDTYYMINPTNSASTPETPAETVARLRAAGWSAARILSGLGHPGYSGKSAAKAVAAIEAGVRPHEAVYGPRKGGWTSV